MATNQSKSSHMQALSTYASGIWQLSKRNILLFLKNKTTVFFSLLAPILIFLLYTVFLGSMQINAMRGFLPSGVTVDDATLKGIFDSWMVSGVVGIACLTVSLNSMLVMISDKESKTINDFNSSPISRVSLLISYFLSSVILTFTLCLILLIVVLFYLGISSGTVLSFGSICQLVLVLFLSCLSAVILMMCIMSLFRTNASVTAFSGIFSALIGFLTGAYLPASILPPALEGISALVPGSHSIGLIRSIIMEEAFLGLPASFPAEFLNTLKLEYASSLSFFGMVFKPFAMYLYLIASIVVFFFVYLAIDRIKGRKN